MEGLAELVDDFPYSQNIRQLYLKALYQNESVKFESELKKTAAHTSNRSHLKAFILNDDFEKDNTQEVILTVVKTPKENIELKTPLQESPEKENIDLKDEDSETKTQILPEAVVKEKQKTTEINDPALNDQFLSEAINASISMEVGQEQNKEELTTSATQQPKPSHEKPEEVAQKRNFIQWIKYYDQEQQTKAVDRANFKEKAANLIDQFINSQPKITPKKDFYSPINMANKSLQETDEFASETLANIYFQQGNSGKAIKMYQSLSLKFPEKKAYFANQIGKIRNTQNK